MQDHHRITGDNENDINMNEDGAKITITGDCKEITSTKIEPMDNHYQDGVDEDDDDSYYHENKVQVCTYCHLFIYY